MSEDNDDGRKCVRGLFEVLCNDPKARAAQARDLRPVSERPTVFIIASSGALQVRHSVAVGHPFRDTAAAAVRVLEDYLREPFMHTVDEHGYAVAFECLQAVVVCFRRCPELNGLNLDVQDLSASSYH